VKADPVVNRYFSEGFWKNVLGSWKAPDQALEDREFWDVLDRCLSRLPRSLSFVSGPCRAFLSPPGVQILLSMLQADPRDPYGHPPPRAVPSRIRRGWVGSFLGRARPHRPRGPRGRP
jgi:hypothetical protein